MNIILTVTIFKIFLLPCSVFSKTLWKRYTDYDLLLPERGNKVACDEGRVVIQCNAGTSVHVISADYGRTEINGVCIKGGAMSNQEICTSPTAFNRVKALCTGKTECTIAVGEDNLGIPLTSEEIPCSSTYKYLELGYRCVPDCDPPKVGQGVAVIGRQFPVSSNATVQCSTGYQPFSNGARLNQITCLLNGSWSGGSITCKDIDECEAKNRGNCDKHADCENSMGSYACICAQGYYGDGFTCDSDTVDKSWIESTKNETYNIVTDSNCGGKVYKHNGILKSPNYPSLYPNSANCQWVLTTMPNKIIEIEFKNFRLEERAKGEGCIKDYVTVYDGPYKNPVYWLSTACGSEIPNTIRSISNQVRVEFKTDQEASFSGFEALFRSFNPLAICENFLGNKYPGVVIVEGNSNETATAGEQVTLGCKPGFNQTSDSSLKRICQNDNTWDDISNPCEAIRCGEPRQFPLHGLTLNGTSEEHHFNGRPLMYQCSAGFILAAAPGVQRIIFCNELGSWSNEGETDFPKCLPISCKITPDLAPPQNAIWTLFDENGNLMPPALGSIVSYRSALEYSCLKGYSMVGEPRRSCNAYQDSEWTGRPISCEEDNGIPGLTNMQIAIIISIISAVLIIVIGASLLYCCVKEKKQRRITQEQQYRHRRMAPKRHYSNHSLMRNAKSYSVSGASLAYGGASHKYKNREPTPTSYSPHNRNSNVALDPQHIKYAQHRPYMLPSVIKPTPPAWAGGLQNGAAVAPKSGLHQDKRIKRQRQGRHPSQNQRRSYNDNHEKYDRR